MSNSSPSRAVIVEVLQCTGTHRPFPPCSAVRSIKHQQGLGVGIWEQQHLQHTSWCLPNACCPPQGLCSTPRAAQYLPAEHQHVAERKTDLKLTFLCCILLLICKLPLISERLMTFDLLQHLHSRAPLLGNFFRSQLLLNCIVF